ncbi:MAG: hypothetical protein KY461_16040 [Actinobacteria bacterium]|nr:hypothetical protein [Actinomycetota bacterium]
MQQLPRTLAGRVQLVAAAVLVLLAFAGSAAARIADAATDAATDATTDAATTDLTVASTDAAPLTDAPGSAQDTFTLGDLAAGRVPQDVQDRFWQAQLDAIRSAPCPVGTGGTAVTLYLGADEAWTARLRAASEAHAAACAA